MKKNNKNFANGIDTIFTFARTISHIINTNIKKTLNLSDTKNTRKYIFVIKASIKSGTSIIRSYFAIN